MNKKAKHIVFIVFAVLAFIAALYHIAAFVQPFDTSPAWRHAIFIAVCTICIYGLLKRPKWFVWFFGILMIQQLYSHGSHLLLLMKEDQFNLIDAAVVLSMPLAFVLLLQARKTNGG
jgi:predicted membrane protein